MSLNAHGLGSQIHPLSWNLDLAILGNWTIPQKKHRPFLITKGILQDASSCTSYKLSSISSNGQTMFDYMTSMLSMIVRLKHFYLGEYGDEVDAH